MVVDIAFCSDEVEVVALIECFVLPDLAQGDGESFVAVCASCAVPDGFDVDYGGLGDCFGGLGEGRGEECEEGCQQAEKVGHLEVWFCRILFGA